MDRESVSRKLTPIFQDVFDDPSLHVSDGMTAADVEDWDSLSHIHLIIAVEEVFAVKFTTAEIRGLNNVGDFVTLIAKKAA
jgi:acyl carrier protein